SVQPFSSTASEKFFAAPATPEPLRTSTVIESSATLTSLPLGEGSAEVDSEASEAGGSAIFDSGLPIDEKMMLMAATTSRTATSASTMTSEMVPMFDDAADSCRWRSEG